MKQSIYYIFDTPPLESYYERYAMSYFSSMQWDVCVIDLSPIIHPEAFRIVTTDLIHSVERKLFNNKKEYVQFAKSIPDGAVFVFTTDFIYDIYFVYKCIRNTQYYGYITRVDTNVEPEKKTMESRIKGLFSKDIFNHVRNSFFVRIPRNWFPIKPADYMLLGGMANRDEYIRLGYTDEHTKICHIHSMDYEQYLKIKNGEKRFNDDKYCVFLDEYLPYHPDNVAEGTAIEPNEYYRDMNAFFQLLELKYGVKVVVAIHPRADIDVCKKAYAGFEVRKNETAVLIRDCEFVVAHFSTAISFAVAFYKPVILCYTDSIWANDSWRTVESKYAFYLGVDTINVSGSSVGNLPGELKVNEDKYKEFLRLYMKADIDTEDESFGQCFYRELSEIMEA